MDRPCPAFGSTFHAVLFGKPGAQKTFVVLGMPPAGCRGGHRGEASAEADHYTDIPCRTGSGFQVNSQPCVNWRPSVAEIRLFARQSRDQLTSLANRHIGAVLPGGAVPVATLLSKLC